MKSITSYNESEKDGIVSIDVEISPGEYVHTSFVKTQENRKIADQHLNQILQGTR